MSDDDLISRGDALNICTRFPYPEGIATAISTLPAVDEAATWNAAIRAAAEAMRPMLRSMVSRGDASDTILALLKQEKQ